MSPMVLNEPKALTPLKAQVRLLMFGYLVLAILIFVARSRAVYRIHELYLQQNGTRRKRKST